MHVHVHAYVSRFNVLYSTSPGGLTSATISFTALHTNPNVSPPQFTLTCRSEGGPATNVTWQRDGVTVQEDSDHQTSQIIVDTSWDAVYENRLRVTGREGGAYQCTVSNNRDDFPEETPQPHTVTSSSFNVQGK